MVLFFCNCGNLDRYYLNIFVVFLDRTNIYSKERINMIFIVRKCYQNRLLTPKFIFKGFSKEIILKQPLLRDYIKLVSVKWKCKLYENLLQDNMSEDEDHVLRYE